MPDIGKQIFRVPITRLDTEHHMVYGYASTGRVDAYDTIFDPSWWPHAVSGYLEDRTLSAMHDEPDVGTVPILEIDENGLWIGAKVHDLAEWERIENEEYNGFSIEAIPYDFKEEIIEGRSITRFTKFVLTGITIGYPVANLDARFQLVERLEYDDSSPWDWDWKKDGDAIVDALGWKGLKQACLYQDADKDPETKDAYKLPVAKMKRGKLTVFWNGCRAAMAVLNGARGGLDIPESARKSAYAKLKKYYKHFDKELPELRLNGGTTMSTFTEKVVDVLKRLSGKDPDDAAKKEISELETRLADEKTKKLDELSETVTKLTERLGKLETGDQDSDKDGGQTTDEGKKLDEIAESVGKVEERLAAVEKGIAASKQPGEDGETQNRTQAKKDIFAGAIFPDRI